MKIIKHTIFLVILTAILIACQQEPKKKNTKSLNVKVAPVARKEVVFPVHSCGRLSAKEEVKLSFKTGGIIKKIYVTEGEQVKKGDKLAQLNLSEIQAKVEAAEAALEKARRDYRRADTLYRDSVVTLEQFQNAGTALNVAKSDFEVARFNLIHSVIKAPANGTVLRKLAEENEMMAAGHPVFLFGTSHKYWMVEANVTDQQIIHIRSGDTANVVFDAFPEKIFKGIVNETGRYADPYTGTYEVELKVDQGRHQLMSGFIARVDIYPSKKDSFSVFPLKAVTDLSKKSCYIYIIEDTVPVRKKISFDRITEEKVYTKEKFRQGTRYIKEGVEYVGRPGEKIKIQ